MCRQALLTLACYFIFLTASAMKEDAIAQDIVQEHELFVAVPDSLSSLTVHQEKKLRNIAERPTTGDFRLVYAPNVDKLITVQYITVDVFSHSKKAFARKQLQENAQYGFVWYGSTEQNDNITLVILGQELTGTVRIGREIYRIQPLGLGVHLRSNILYLAHSLRW
jgi:hypothetical protein